MAVLLLQMGCLTRTASLQFVADELDRVAIVHNKSFRPVYMDCQAELNDLHAYNIDRPPRAGILDYGVVSRERSLQDCSRDLKDAWEDVQARIENFDEAVDSLR